MEKVLKGLPVSRKIYRDLKTEIEQFTVSPHLTIIQVGSDAGSDFYVSNLLKKGNKIGITVSILKEKESIQQEKLIGLIQKLNEDKAVDGIMVQKPLPPHIDETYLNKMINPAKDVDGFHPFNLGNMLLGDETIIPCTPAAVLELCTFYSISLAGKHVVVLGRSSIVGKPLANLLLQKHPERNATVTVCHSRTKNLANFTKQADILVAAIGKANFVDAGMIKKNAIILDVGVNLVKAENEEEKYVGDVDYKSCFDKVLAITPVPGGLGTVTTALLLKNVVSSYKNAKK